MWEHKGLQHGCQPLRVVVAREVPFCYVRRYRRQSVQAANPVRLLVVGGGNMGLFGFGRGPRVDKLVKKVKSAYAQTQDRHQAMRQLADLGTDEAVAGLLQRFTYKTEASSVDQDEKETACNLLVDVGATAVPSIERFINFSDAVYWPLTALKQIVGLEHTVGVLLAALDKADGLDMRVNERKIQLVRRQSLEVVRPVKPCRSVHRPTSTFEKLEVLTLGDVGRSLEHHVLE